MDNHLLVVESYFDGHTHFDNGPYTIEINKGIVANIATSHNTLSPVPPPNTDIHKAAFAMPGLVEAHSHLFLEGAELDFKKRSDYLKADRKSKLKIARNSIQKSLQAGITLIRDAGDIYGINTGIRAELKQVDYLAPSIQAAGMAIRKTGRYGRFMAKEIGNLDNLSETIETLASKADQLKVLMTGIIDFKLGKVKGRPQFTLEETRQIVALAKTFNLQTFAHCSGLAGIQIAVEAGIDSIEHGFFIDQRALEIMADKQIAWVPTFSPVVFQWANPTLAGWNTGTVHNLRQILDAHNKHLLIAEKLGVPIIAGSDAGSYGVEHGKALIDELVFMTQAGLPLASVLQSATTRPRKHWALQSATLQTGSPADLILLEESPFASIEGLKQVQTVLKDRFVFSPALTA